MLKISFNDLVKHYPRKRDVDRETLFRQLGWDDLIKNPAYDNTCAIRVSVALIRSSVTIPDGRIPIKTDPHKGKKVEPGQAKLSAILSLPSMLGKPEKYRGPESIMRIGNRSGIVSFFRLTPGVYDGGHIDIVGPLVGGVSACGTSCYWSSAETWFWPLK